MPKVIHNCKQTPLLGYTSAQRKQEYRTVSYLLPQDDLPDNKLMASLAQLCSDVKPAKTMTPTDAEIDSYWMAVHGG